MRRSVRQREAGQCPYAWLQSGCAASSGHLALAAHTPACLHPTASSAICFLCPAGILLLSTIAVCPLPAVLTVSLAWYLVLHLDCACASLLVSSHTPACLHPTTPIQASTHVRLHPFKGSVSTVITVIPGFNELQPYKASAIPGFSLARLQPHQGVMWVSPLYEFPYRASYKGLIKPSTSSTKGCTHTRLHPCKASPKQAFSHQASQAPMSLTGVMSFCSLNPLAS